MKQGLHKPGDGIVSAQSGSSFSAEGADYACGDQGGLLTGLADYFRNFSADALANIQLITACCGKLLNAQGAFYSRQVEDKLKFFATWNTPQEAVLYEDPRGRVCDDVIQRDSDEVVVIKDVRTTPFWETDPHLKPMGVISYIGCACTLGNRHVGALCAVFDHVRDFSNQEKALISLAASVIGSEETRRQAENALSSAREKHNAIFEAALDHIYIKDKNFCYTALNPAGEDFFGLDESQVLGKDDLHFFAPESASYIHEMDQRVLNGAVINQKKELADIHGEKRDFHVIKVPLRGQDGRVEGICGIARDVTHTRLLEKQQVQMRKMQALGALAGGLAHDFNNILAAIMGYTELALENATCGSDNQDELEVVLKATERAKALVRQIMTFSSKVRLEPVSMDLNREVRQACMILENTLPGNIAFELNFGKHLGRMKGDPAKIGQVILNLGLNAADAMPQGGTITFKTRAQELPLESRPETQDQRPGLYLMLSIRDNGCGMDEKTCERVFEPFFTTKDLGKGMGLGLSTAFGIVKSHGGRIFCQSSPNKGSVFTLYFPMLAPEPGSSEKVDFLEADDAPGGNELIMVVDDEDNVRHLARTILERKGYSVLGASSGETALSLFSANQTKIHLVIMDLGMPGMSGTQCLERLLALKPDLKFMVASGYARKQDANGMASLGEVPFLGKPFTVKDLLFKVRQVIDQDQE